MRKTPEAFDDVAVPLRVVEKALVVLAPRFRYRRDKLLVTPDGLCLQRAVLRMLERQIEECPLHGRELQVDAAVDAGQRKLLRGRILGKGPRCPAMNMARELVEQNDQGEPPECGRAPG